MAKFTAPVALNIHLPGGFEAIGAAGTTHRIPDALVEEFLRDQAPLIPGGVTWITQDEMTSIPGDLAITGGLTVAGALTASSVGGIVQVSTASALQVAINALSATGGDIFVTPGTYTLSAALTIPGDHIRIFGAGRRATTLVWTGSGAAVVNSNTASTRRNFYIGDLSINNSGATTSAGGVKLENFYNAIIERVEFTGVGASGIGVEFSGTGSTYFNIVRDCFFNLSTVGGTGVKWTGSANANSVVGSIFSATTGCTNINVSAGDTSLILGCMIAAAGETTATNLTVAASASFLRVIGCRFEAGAVTITGTDVRLVGNTHANDAMPTITGARSVSVADGSPRLCIVTSTVSQAMISSTLTTVTFNSEIADDWQMHSGSSGDVTIPAGLLSSRFYRVTGTIVWPANATGIRQAHIYKNGASFKQTVLPAAASAADRLTQTVIWDGALVAGDVLNLVGFQNSGGDLSLSNASETIRATLTVQQIP